MTRDELLQFAGQWHFSQTSTRVLAGRITSPAAIAREQVMQTARAEKFSRQSARAWTAFVVGVVCVFLGLGVVVAQDYLQVPAIIAAPLIGAGLVIILSSMYFAAGVSDQLDVTQATLAALRPVFQSSECKTALEYITGGQPAVLAWRDLAVAEREVLCSFDVQIMRELHYASKAADEAAAVRSENEKACRQLYGIAEQDELPSGLRTAELEQGENNANT